MKHNLSVSVVGHQLKQETVMLCHWAYSCRRPSFEQPARRPSALSTYNTAVSNPLLGSVGGEAALLCCCL